MSEQFKSIRKILIANRGEIACRVIETCRKRGITSVAVYSDADKNARHVRMADEAYHIGPPAAAESYLVADKLIEVAKAAHIDAIHPGYGFLSENPEFAERLDAEGIIFMGPSASAMRAMALKGAAKALMIDANVPVVPGYHGEAQDDATLIAEAKKVGFPLLIKAVAGGGGKGMRLVEEGGDIAAAIAAARREGENSFGNGTLLIEKFIQQPRHIEIQVFGDKLGNHVHLYERDCSLQRRHQKVVEEAPAPDMPEDVRKAMGDAAVRAAKAIDYAGAGTVEFIVDGSGTLTPDSFYFMEMNTRLQVEHPVTEYITGEDLVAWQIDVAAGKPLPKSQGEINAAVKGHAIEVRLYAEDPANDFLPAVGPVALFDYSVRGDNQRVDTGIETGDEVSIHYDPMIAKLIAYGEDRNAAIAELSRLLRGTALLGLTHNRDFLIRSIEHEAFVAGDVHTGFIEQYSDDLIAPLQEISGHEYMMAALAVHQDKIPCPGDPWDQCDGFLINRPSGYAERFELQDGEEAIMNIQSNSGSVTISTSGLSFTFESITTSDGWVKARCNGQTVTFNALVTDEEVKLATDIRTVVIKRHTMANVTADTAEGPGTVTAPMPGKILDVLVANGDHVEMDTPLIIMEAMKMEQTLKAGKSGVVSELSVKNGDQVADGALLLEITDNE